MFNEKTKNIDSRFESSLIQGQWKTVTDLHQNKIKPFPRYDLFQFNG